MEWPNPEAERLRARLKNLPPDEAVTTIDSFEEQMRGWMDRLAKAKTVAREVAVYDRLLRQLRNYCAIRILEFDDRAAVEFQRLRKQKVRVRTMDLKIAAIVLTQGATLLSRNLRDFVKVPGLLVEDWTK